MVKTVVEVVVGEVVFQVWVSFFFIKLQLSWEKVVSCEDLMKWPLLSLYLHCSLFSPKKLFYTVLYQRFVFADALQILCSLFDIVPYLYLQEMLYRICICKRCCTILVFARVLYQYLQELLYRISICKKRQLFCSRSGTGSHLLHCTQGALPRHRVVNLNKQIRWNCKTNTNTNTEQIQACFAHLTVMGYFQLLGSCNSLVVHKKDPENRSKADFK